MVAHRTNATTGTPMSSASAVTSLWRLMASGTCSCMWLKIAPASRLMRTHIFAGLSLALGVCALGAQQTPIGPTPPGMFDETIPPGANFDKADFRFWAPAGASSLRGVLVLVP